MTNLVIAVPSRSPRERNGGLAANERFMPLTRGTCLDILVYLISGLGLAWSTFGKYILITTP